MEDTSSGYRRRHRDDFSLLVFSGLAFAFGYPLVNGLTHFANALPVYVDKAQHGKGWIGHLVRKYHVEAWVQKNSPKIISFAESLGKPALALGKGAFGSWLSWRRPLRS